jgi:type IV pilus assembly protein PilO
VSDLQKEIQVLRVKASRLEEFEAEVEVLDAELLRALRELPDRKEMDTLLARISDKAKDSGLDVELFKPEGEIKRDFYAEVPVTLELRGEYHEIAGFFDEVAHLDRIVNMDKFNIAKESARKGNSEGLKTTVVATSFRFLDESERPKEEDKKDGKRRGKKK